MDRVVEVIVRALVLLARVRSRLFGDKGQVFKPGKPLRILIVGYNGARNTGADVRVAAIVEQLYELFSPDAIHVSVMTLDAAGVRGYFRPEVELIEFSSMFFFDLYKACSNHHMAIISEGSTLKSTFANALTLFFCEAAGIMKAQGKPCIAYGSEAGDMDGFLERCVRSLCSDTYFIARTQPSLDVIRSVGLQGHLGTDTAWTFDGSRERERARSLLLEQGWDGKKPLLGVAVVNPFWWPVKPSVTRLVRSLITGDRGLQFQNWYFFSWSEERKRQYEAYLGALAQEVGSWCEKNGFQPVVIGMERLDERACQDLCKLIDTPVPVVLSRDYDGYVISQVLTSLSLLVTSRYHAQVLAMEGAVPTVCVSMDERLDNMARLIGHADHLLFAVDDPLLHAGIQNALVWAEEYRDRIARDIVRVRTDALEEFARMGEFLKAFVEEGFFDEHGSGGVPRGEGDAS